MTPNPKDRQIIKKCMEYVSKNGIYSDHNRQGLSAVKIQYLFSVGYSRANRIWGTLGFSVSKVDPTDRVLRALGSEKSRGAWSSVNTKGIGVDEIRSRFAVSASTAIKVRDALPRPSTTATIQVDSATYKRLQTTSRRLRVPIGAIVEQLVDKLK